MITVAIIVYVVLSIITDVIVFYNIGKWNRYNIFSPLHFLLILMIALLQMPAWIMAFSDRAMGHEASVAWGLAASAVAPLFVLLGAKLMGRPAMNWRQWWKQPLYYNPTHTSIAILLFGLILLGIAIQIYAVGGLGRVPLIANVLHPGQGAMLRDMREEAFKFQPLYIRYPIAFSRHVFSFMAVSILVGAAVYKLGGRLWLLPILLFAAINAAMQGAKDPPAAIMLLALMAWFMISGKRIRARTIIVVMLGLSVFPVFFTVTRLGTTVTLDDIGQAYGYLGNRVFVAPAACVMSTFMYVPDISGDFFYGQTINLWAVVTGREAIVLPNLVYRAWAKSTFRSGFTNAAYYADAWANFSWAGVILVSMMVGAFIGLFERIILTSRKTFVSIACVMTMVVGVRALISVPFTSWVLSDVGVATLLIAFLSRRMPEYSPISDGDYLSA